jgi:hypothetical protein
MKQEDKFQKLFDQEFILNPLGVTRNLEIHSRIAPLCDGPTEYKEFKVWLSEMQGIKAERRCVHGIMPRVRRGELALQNRIEIHAPGRFFITAAVAGAKVHEGFLKTAKDNFCRRADAQLIVLPMNAHVRALEDQPDHYALQILELMDRHVFTSVTINEHLIATDLFINPQQEYPLTGLSSHALFKGHSAILAHPKQHYRTVATGANSLPRALLTTGVCTLPDYQENKQGLKAKAAHVIGGVIVEVTETNGVNRFHVRHVQANEDGSFTDILGATVQDPGATLFKPDGSIEKTKALGIVFGDLHSNELDHKAFDTALAINRRLRPEYTVVADVLSCTSINHHNEGIKARQKRPTLEKELCDCLAVLRSITDNSDTSLLVVEANHDKHLIKYLEDVERWRTDTTNIRCAADLFHKYVLSKDEISFMAGVLCKGPNNGCSYVAGNSDMTIGGFRICDHGHTGLKGSKGSLRQFKEFAPTIKHHTHSPEITDFSIQVGCLCKLQQDYDKTFNNNLHSVCVIYPNRKFSHVVILDGEFTIEGKDLKK